MTGPQAWQDGAGLVMVMAVESAELAGAVTVALGVARQAAGELPVAAITAAEVV